MAFLPSSDSWIELLVCATVILVSIIYFWQIFAPRVRARKTGPDYDAMTQDALRRYREQQREASSDKVIESD